jgi:hypothetical protein
VQDPLAHFLVQRSHYWHRPGLMVQGPLAAVS